MDTMDVDCNEGGRQEEIVTSSDDDEPELIVIDEKTYSSDSEVEVTVKHEQKEDKDVKVPAHRAFEPELIIIDDSDDDTEFPVESSQNKMLDNHNQSGEGLPFKIKIEKDVDDKSLGNQICEYNKLDECGVLIGAKDSESSTTCDVTLDTNSKDYAVKNDTDGKTNLLHEEQNISISEPSIVHTNENNSSFTKDSAMPSAESETVFSTSKLGIVNDNLISMTKHKLVSDIETKPLSFYEDKLAFYEEKLRSATEAELLSIIDDERVISTKDKLVSIVEDEPMTSTEDEPMISTEDEPVTSTEDEPVTSTEDEPVTSTEDEPVTSTEDEPVTSTEDEPVTSTEDELVTSTEDKPVTSTENEPATSTEDKLETSNEDKPVTCNENKPVTSNGNKPVTSNENKPITCNENKPVTCNENKPVTSNGNKPITINENKPETSNENKPVTSSENKATPSNEGKATPSSEEKATPSSEEKATPSSEEKATPSSEEKATPSSDEKATPSSEEKATASNEEKAAASNEERATPSNEDKLETYDKDKLATFNVNKLANSNIDKLMTSNEDKLATCKEDMPVLNITTNQMPILKDKSMPILKDKSIPILKGKSMPILKGKSMPILKDKSMPILKDKSMPISEDKPVSIFEGKSVPISEDKLLPTSSVEGKLMSPIKDKSELHTSNKTEYPFKDKPRSPVMDKLSLFSENKTEFLMKEGIASLCENKIISCDKDKVVFHAESMAVYSDEDKALSTVKDIVYSLVNKVVILDENNEATSVEDCKMSQDENKAVSAIKDIVYSLVNKVVILDENNEATAIEECKISHNENKAVLLNSDIAVSPNESSKLSDNKTEMTLLNSSKKILLNDGKAFGQFFGKFTVGYGSRVHTNSGVKQSECQKEKDKKKAEQAPKSIESKKSSATSERPIIVKSITGHKTALCEDKTKSEKKCDTKGSKNNTSLKKNSKKEIITYSRKKVVDPPTKPINRDEQKEPCLDTGTMALEQGDLSNMLECQLEVGTPNIEWNKKVQNWQKPQFPMPLPNTIINDTIGIAPKLEIVHKIPEGSIKLSNEGFFSIKVLFTGTKKSHSFQGPDGPDLMVALKAEHFLIDPVKWLIVKKFASANTECPKCKGKQLRQIKTSVYVDGYAWSCLNQQCKHVQSFNRPPFLKFDHSLASILAVVYHWTFQSHHQHVMIDSNLTLDSLMILYQTLQHLCSLYTDKYDRESKRVVKPYDVMEMAVFQFGSFLILAAYERNTKHIRLRAVVTVEELFVNALSKLSEGFINCNHLIVSDCSLLEQLKIPCMGFAYANPNIIDENDSGWHCLNVLSFVRQHVQGIFKKFEANSVTRDIWQGFLNEVEWRQRYGLTSDQAFWSMLYCIAMKQTITYLHETNQAPGPIPQITETQITSKAVNPKISDKARKSFIGLKAKLQDLQQQANNKALPQISEPTIKASQSDVISSIMFQPDGVDAVTVTSLLSIRTWPLVSYLQNLIKAARQPVDYKIADWRAKLEKEDFFLYPLRWLVNNKFTPGNYQCDKCQSERVCFGENEQLFLTCGNNKCRNVQPLKRPKFFSKFGFPMKELLFLLYHWTAQSSFQSICEDVVLNEYKVRYVFWGIQKHCSAILYKNLKLAKSNQIVEVGIIQYGEFCILGALNRQTKETRLRAMYAPMLYKSCLFEPALNEWLCKGATILTSHNPFPLRDYRVMHVADNEDTPLNTKSINLYLKSIINALFSQYSTIGIKVDIIQSFLDEIQWRQKYGCIPETAFMNLLKQFATEWEIGYDRLIPQLSSSPSADTMVATSDNKALLMNNKISTLENPEKCLTPPNASYQNTKEKAQMPGSLVSSGGSLGVPNSTSISLPLSQTRVPQPSTSFQSTQSSKPEKRKAKSIPDEIVGRRKSLRHRSPSNQDKISNTESNDDESSLDRAIKSKKPKVADKNEVFKISALSAEQNATAGVLISKFSKESLKKAELAEFPFEEYFQKLPSQTVEMRSNCLWSFEKKGGKLLRPVLNDSFKFLKKMKTEETKAIHKDECKQRVPLDEYYFAELKSNAAPSVDPISYVYSCTYCKIYLFGNIEVIDHTLKHIVDRREKNSPKAFTCPFLIQRHISSACCLYEFSSEEEQKRHISDVHLHEDSLSCLICSLPFPSSHELGKHMKEAHFPCEMPYTCPACCYRSSVHKEVLEHFQLIHKNDPHLICPYCLKMCSPTRTDDPVLFTNSFSKHLYRHQVMSGNVKCPSCCLLFFTYDELYAHAVRDHVSFLDFTDTVAFRPRCHPFVVLIKPAAFPILSSTLHPAAIYANSKLLELTNLKNKQLLQAQKEMEEENIQSKMEIPSKMEIQSKEIVQSEKKVQSEDKAQPEENVQVAEKIQPEENVQFAEKIQPEKAIPEVLRPAIEESELLDMNYPYDYYAEVPIEPIPTLEINTLRKKECGDIKYCIDRPLQCFECHNQVDNKHFYKPLHCHCNYVTYCAKAFALHMIKKHFTEEEIHQASSVIPRKLTKRGVCSCSFSSDDADILASHLKICDGIINIGYIEFTKQYPILTRDNLSPMLKQLISNSSSTSGLHSACLQTKGTSKLATVVGDGAIINSQNLSISIERQPPSFMNPSFIFANEQMGNMPPPSNFGISNWQNIPQYLNTTVTSAPPIFTNSDINRPCSTEPLGEVICGYPPGRSILRPTGNNNLTVRETLNIPITNPYLRAPQPSFPPPNPSYSIVPPKPNGRLKAGVISVRNGVTYIQEVPVSMAGRYPTQGPGHLGQRQGVSTPAPVPPPGLSPNILRCLLRDNNWIPKDVTKHALVIPRANLQQFQQQPIQDPRQYQQQHQLLQQMQKQQFQQQAQKQQLQQQAQKQQLQQQVQKQQLQQQVQKQIQQQQIKKQQIPQLQQPSTVTDVITNIKQEKPD